MLATALSLGLADDVPQVETHYGRESSMSVKDWFGIGKSEAQKGQGQQDKSGMKWQDKEKYDAGHNKGKEEQKKK